MPEAWTRSGTMVSGLAVGGVRETRGVANWSPLRDKLASVDDRIQIAWADLDGLVGGLPRSAYDHQAFWSGDRSGWPGFTTTDVRVGRSVTFVRRGGQRAGGTAVVSREAPVTPTHAAQPVDLVLVGCAKQKRATAAPAQDLYTSPLFRKSRAYAESTGIAWFVLSAKHGLVGPEAVLEPYDVTLSRTSRDYRREWARRVLRQLDEACGSLDGRSIEIHAGTAYTSSLRPLLESRGAVVVEPLQGLRQGQRLAWYGSRSGDATASVVVLEASEIAASLTSPSSRQSPAEFLATGGDGLRRPGLYSWWVDGRGAADLSLGLGHPVAAGLIYAGLAGATRSRSGRRSSNTLWGRISGMHLGGRHEFSTFRLSLGSVLAAAEGLADIDEEALTIWMHEHLLVAAVPVADADGLDGLESAILRTLDPPLNLSKMPPSPVRRRLTELRKTYKQEAPAVLIGTARAGGPVVP